MSFQELPICIWCRHFKPVSKGNIRPTCEAFPSGIPREIIPLEQSVTFDHRYSHPDDQGIQFEPHNDVEELMKFRAIREIVNVYGDKNQIWNVLNQIFQKYDDRRARGTIRPSLDDLPNDKVNI